MLRSRKYVYTLIPLSAVALQVRCQSSAAESSQRRQAVEEIPTHKLTCHRTKLRRHGKPCVLVSCGSFNPPTMMHLRMFESGRDYLRKVQQFCIVWGIVVSKPTPS
jgi:hypothetical protein